MQDISRNLIDKASAMLADGSVRAVLGWKRGEFFYDPTPALFERAEELEDFVYDSFCGANLSKYLIQESKKEGKILIFLKPCDSYSLNQLLLEHRVDREKLYIVGICCWGKLDINKIRAKGVKGILSVEDDGENVRVHTLYGDTTLPRGEVKLDKCLACKGSAHKIFDERIHIGDEREPASGRFAMVEQLEAMTPDERFAFWRGELSRCIRCNACRNVCPACSCEKCVFDNDSSPIASKANADPSEENMFHIIRAFHVCGRCTDCGECSRVCPQHIPLHLLNRKFIKDINTFYGEFQAGEDAFTPGPLTAFTKSDIEPSAVSDKEGN